MTQGLNPLIFYNQSLGSWGSSIITHKFMCLTLLCELSPKKYKNRNEAISYNPSLLIYVSTSK